MSHRPLMLILASLLLASCGGAASEATEMPEPTMTDPSEQSTEPDTPQAFIDALEAATVRDGQILHTTVTVAGGEVGVEPEALSTDELWIYGAQGQVRNHFHIDPNAEEQSPQSIFVVHGNQVYYKSSTGQVEVGEGQPARTCPLVESTLIVHNIVGLFCAAFTPQEGEVNDIQAHVDTSAEFEGTDAVVLIYEAHNELEPNATPEPERAPDLTISRFYVDDETFLPLGWTVEMHVEHEDLTVEITADYSNEFIPRDELPDDLFNPDWIDYAEETS